MFYFRLLSGIVLACFLGAAPALAQVPPASAPEQDPDEPELPRYAVELLVFRNLGAGLGRTEVWSRKAMPTALESALAARELEEVAEEALLEDPLIEETLLPELAEEEVPPSEEEPPAEAEGPAELVDDAAILDEYFRVPDFQLIPVEELELSELRQRMASLGDYEPLFHIAWIQVGHGREEAKPFNLPPDEELVTEQGAFRADPPAVPDPDRGAADAAPAGPAYWIEPPVPERPIPGEVVVRIVGNATLWLGTYLHLDLDLEMETGADMDIPTQPAIVRADQVSRGPERYVLQEKRRVQRRQLHYFDHPRFGVIAQVSRYEPESGEEGDAGG